MYQPSQKPPVKQSDQVAKDQMPKKGQVKNNLKKQSSSNNIQTDCTQNHNSSHIDTNYNNNEENTKPYEDINNNRDNAQAAYTKKNSLDDMDSPITKPLKKFVSRSVDPYYSKIKFDGMELVYNNNDRMKKRLKKQIIKKKSVVEDIDIGKIKDMFSYKNYDETDNRSKNSTLNQNDNSQTDCYLNTVSGAKTGVQINKTENDRNFHTSTGYNQKTKPTQDDETMGYMKTPDFYQQEFASSSKKFEAKTIFGDFMKMILDSKVGEEHSIESKSDSKDDKPNYMKSDNDRYLHKIHKYFDIEAVKETSKKSDNKDNFKRQNQSTGKKSLGKVNNKMMENAHKSKHLAIKKKLQKMDADASPDDIKEMFDKGIPELISIFKCFPEDLQRRSVKKKIENCFYKIYHNSQTAAISKASNKRTKSIPFATNFENVKEFEQIMMIKKTYDMQKKLSSDLIYRNLSKKVKGLRRHAGNKSSGKKSNAQTPRNADSNDSQRNVNKEKKVGFGENSTQSTFFNQFGSKGFNEIEAANKFIGTTRSENVPDINQPTCYDEEHHLTDRNNTIGKPQTNVLEIKGDSPDELSRVTNKNKILSKNLQIVENGSISPSQLNSKRRLNLDRESMLNDKRQDSGKKMKNFSRDQQGRQEGKIADSVVGSSHFGKENSTLGVETSLQAKTPRKTSINKQSKFGSPQKPEKPDKISGQGNLFRLSTEKFRSHATENDGKTTTVRHPVYIEKKRKNDQLYYFEKLKRKLKQDPLYKMKKNALRDVKTRLVSHHLREHICSMSDIKNFHNYLENFRMWYNFKDFVELIYLKDISDMKDKLRRNIKFKHLPESKHAKVIKFNVYKVAFFDKDKFIQRFLPKSPNTSQETGPVHGKRERSSSLCDMEVPGDVFGQDDITTQQNFKSTINFYTHRQKKETDSKYCYKTGYQFNTVINKKKTKTYDNGFFKSEDKFKKSNTQMLNQLHLPLQDVRNNMTPYGTVRYDPNMDTFNRNTLSKRTIKDYALSLADTRLKQIRGSDATKFADKIKENNSSFKSRRHFIRVGNSCNRMADTKTNPDDFELMQNKMDIEDLMLRSRNFMNGLKKEQTVNKHDYEKVENNFVNSKRNRAFWEDGSYERYIKEKRDPMNYLTNYFKENFDPLTTSLASQLQRSLSLNSKNKISQRLDKQAEQKYDEQSDYS